MLNNYVVSFCDNFGLIFTGSEDMATNGIVKWPLWTTARLNKLESSKNQRVKIS